jgi:two-component system NtrC family response regulator
VNTLDRAFLVAYYEPILFAKHLPVEFRTHFIKSALHKNAVQSESLAGVDPGAADALPPFKQFRQNAMDRLDREYLEALIFLSRGNLIEAGRISGLGRTRLYVLLKKSQGRLHEGERWGGNGSGRRTKSSPAVLPP